MIAMIRIVPHSQGKNQTSCKGLPSQEKDEIQRVRGHGGRYTYRISLLSARDEEKGRFVQVGQAQMDRSPSLYFGVKPPTHSFWSTPNWGVLMGSELIESKGR